MEICCWRRKSLIPYFFLSTVWSPASHHSQVEGLYLTLAGTANREAVFPTCMIAKTNLKGANTGQSSLKCESEALTKCFCQITKRINAAKRRMGRVMRIASFSLAEVTYAAEDVGSHVQESVKSARFRVRARQEIVGITRPDIWVLIEGSGVYLPTFESVTRGGEWFGLMGLGWGVDSKFRSTSLSSALDWFQANRSLHEKRRNPHRICFPPGPALPTL